MALGVAQRILAAGAAPTYAVPAASEAVVWPAGANELFVHVKNANAAACVVTVTSRAVASDGLAATNKEVTVPLTTGDRIFRVSPAFKHTDGKVTITFSVQSDVSGAILY